MEVTFTWKYGGNNVVVCGSFNDWNGEEMGRDSSGVWTLKKNLNRGAYQYKFKVDGNWCYDMEKSSLTDKFGNCNNVLCIDFTLPTPFWWKLAGKKLEVAGTFNNWRCDRMHEIALPNELSIHPHYVELNLPLGFYQYKFISDDRWLYDDHQPHNYFDGILNNYRQVNVNQSELFYFYSESAHLGLQYTCYIPEGYSNGERWPLILYLHSLKVKGESIQLLEEEGIPKEIKHGRNLPFIVLSPQCPKGSLKWSSISVYLMDLINHFCHTRNVDRSRLYLTGVEMGAYGIWKLALDNPTTFAALAPFGGGGDVTKVKLVTHLPVWITDHQYRSTLGDSQEIVEALRAVNGNVQFTIESSPDNRDCWSKAYGGDDLYRWFLSHQNHHNQ